MLVMMTKALPKQNRIRAPTHIVRTLAQSHTESNHIVFLHVCHTSPFRITDAPLVVPS